MKFQKELTLYYPSYVNGKILTNPHTRMYYNEKDYIKIVNNNRLFFNEQYAIDSIKPYIKESIDKFEKCKALFFSLQKNQGIDINHCIEGDTQGIEDYMEISFCINGFSFSYRI